MIWLDFWCCRSCSSLFRRSEPILTAVSPMSQSSDCEFLACGCTSTNALPHWVPGNMLEGYGPQSIFDFPGTRARHLRLCGKTRCLGCNGFGDRVQKIATRLIPGKLCRIWIPRLPQSCTWTQNPRHPRSRGLWFPFVSWTGRFAVDVLCVTKFCGELGLAGIRLRLQIRSARLPIGLFFNVGIGFRYP